MAKRLQATKEGLKLLLGIHPLTLHPQGFWRGSVPQAWGYSALAKLQDSNLVTRVAGGGLMAVPALAKAALEDERVLLTLLWPGYYKAPADTVEPSVEKETEEAPPTALALGPPPALEGVQRPPLGASPEVVQEWIFTLLHAQTENLIYIRENVDRLLALWEEPKK